ncbi:MAG: hypothetical protein KBC33_03180 [Candidatus Pacebacteria bacterium]|nr:hypothetical protein [Candidatus Paceibacterota bacterium]
MEPTIPTPAPSNDQAVSAQLVKIESPFVTLKFAWDMFLSNWQKLVPVAIVPSAIMYVGTLSFTLGGNIFFAILGILCVVAGIILSVVALVAVIKAVERLNTDQTAQIALKEYYKMAFTYFWSVILVGIISALVGIGGFMLLIVPGIIVSVYVIFYNYALVIDGKRGFGALLESYQLVRGRWRAVLGRAVLIGLVSMAISLIASLIVGLFGGEEAPAAVSGLMNILTTAVISPLTVLFTYRVYGALKAVRQPEVDAKKFKNVLIGFICVGALTIISAVVITPVLMMKGADINSIRMNVEAARKNAEMKSAEVQKLIQEAQSSAVTE